MGSRVSLMIIFHKLFLKQFKMMVERGLSKSKVPSAAVSGFLKNILKCSGSEEK